MPVYLSFINGDVDWIENNEIENCTEMVVA